jgi:HAE1 family hydrophobic/amphiphilic exporter-1
LRGIISFAVKRPVTILMIFLGLIIFGLIAAFDLDLEFLPDIQIPRLIVSASYPGLPPPEMKDLVTVPLEDSLSSVKGLRSLFSVSREGQSTLELEFHWGTDMMMAAVETREAIDLVYPMLPADAKKPVVLPVNPGEEPVIWIGVFPKEGDITLARRLAERELKTRLQQVDGVGSVVVMGGTKEEVKILVDQDKCTGRGITLEGIANILAGMNFDFPAGSFKEGGIEFLVKAEGKVDRIEELGELFVGRNKQGQGIRLKEIAEIKLVTKEKTSVFHLDGKEGVLLLVRRKGGVSPLKLSENIKKELTGLEQSYGRDLEFIVVKDTSKLVSTSINDLVFSAFIGAGIAFIVLLIFLRRLSTSVILISSVPVSILFSLLLIRISGGSLNTMSLGGLALGIGMLVDNSIVVLENLQRKVARASGRQRASRIIEATAEVAGATFGSTVTSLVVFIPVIFLPGVIGALFSDLALSVCYSLTASYLVSVTLVPVLFMLAAGKKKSEEKAGGLERVYRRLFRFFLRRPAFLFLLILLVFGLGVLTLFSMKFEFMAEVDTGEVEVTAVMPPGTSIEYISLVGKTLSEQCHRLNIVDSVIMYAGGSEDDPGFLADPMYSPEKINMIVQLSDERNVDVRRALEELSLVLMLSDGRILLSLPENIITPILGIKSGETVLSIGGEDQDTAMKRAQDILKILSDSNLFSTVTLHPQEEKPEVHIYPSRELAVRYGLSLYQISATVRAALDGIYPTKITLDGRETDVRVMLKEEDRLNLELIKNIQINSAGGGVVVLSEVSDVVFKKGFSSLIRKDRKDVAYLTASHLEETDGEIGDLISLITEERPYTESLLSSAFERNLPRIILTFGLAVVLLYLVLGAQFQSFSLPLLLMLTFPLSFSGILVALLLAGKTINLSSCLGILVLLGIVVNNSIVLFENYRTRFKAGIKPLFCVYRGSAERLKPIVITVLTTVTAMLPIAIDPAGRSLQSSMAVSIIGGLLLSTLLTLFVIPVIFYGYYRKKEK